MIEHYHILIGGFAQSRATVDNGIDQLEQLVHEEHGSSTTRSVYLPWSSDVKEVARWMHKHSNDFPRIQLAGYSFGGQTAVDLATELSEYVLAVESLTLVDAVCRRARHPLGWLSAVNPFARIRVPENVERLAVFRQAQSWPRGHQVVIDRSTTLIANRLIETSHSMIDSESQVRLRILQQADALHTD